MRALKTEATRSAERRWASLGVSLVLHVIGLVVGALTWPDPADTEKPLEVVELALVAKGTQDVEAPPSRPQPRPQPPTQTAPRDRTPAIPDGCGWRG
ncbi:MAG: hypothetical protein AAF211_15815, partial [Myxococcota bacterium]